MLNDRPPLSCRSSLIEAVHLLHYHDVTGIDDADVAGVVGMLHAFRFHHDHRRPYAAVDAKMAAITIKKMMGATMKALDARGQHPSSSASRLAQPKKGPLFIDPLLAMAKDRYETGEDGDAMERP